MPLTLGLSFLLAIMESVYVMTGREIWRDMTQFWGMLFGINFAMGVATGITMEFQFGINWAYYSHYVGDIFGAPLAIEGLMAFFLEVDLRRPVLLRLGPACASSATSSVTWLVALGSNFSALWILIANGWMQNPVGADVQSRHHAHGGDRLLASALQPGRAGQVRAHGQRRLRHRRGVRAGDQRLVPAAAAATSTFAKRSMIVAAELRPGLGAVGRRARRRERLHRRPRTRR